MKCYIAINSPYARKVRVIAHERGVSDAIDWQIITREERAEIVPPINPLVKVPSAVLDSGAPLLDSPVICAYVDSLEGGRNLIPASGDERWAVLTLEAVGDGLGEAVITASQENMRTDGTRSQAVIDRQVGKATNALTMLNTQVGDFNDPPLMGEVAVACALGYMELRDVVPNWRQAYPALASWYTEILKRESFAISQPS